MMKRKVKIIVFSILSVISGFLLIMLVGITLLPIVRKYTVINETDEVIYITPLIQFGGGNFTNLEFEDYYQTKSDYIEKVKDFSILSQYLNYSPPAIPAFTTRDIKVDPKSNTILYIDFEEIKQEGGPQILLIKDRQNNYYYIEANFWGSDLIADKTVWRKATKNLKDVNKNGESSIMDQLFLYCIIVLIIVLFPYLLIKNIKIFRNERKASLEQPFAPSGDDRVI